MSATARIFSGLVITLAAMTGFAGTVSAQQSNWCDDSNATNDQTISGCTADIQSGRFLGERLAMKFYNRGFAYNGKGQYDRAIEDLDQAIKLNPNYALAFNGRGSAYNGKGQYDRAIEDLDQAIKLNSNFALAFNNRSIAYDHKGQYDRAIEDLDEAIKLNPNYALVAALLTPTKANTTVPSRTSTGPSSSIQI
jgi:tetratricopeptide (TPR) repeat protein